MSRRRLTEAEVREETDRLIRVLDWAKSDEGIEYHTENKCTSHVSGILSGILEDLIRDAIENKMNPAYLIGALALRIRGQYPEHRNDLDKLINYDAWDKFKLERT